MSATQDIMATYWRLPALARNMATAVFFLSVSVYTGLLSGRLLIHHPYYLWQLPPQVWRLVTSFLITEPQLGIIFDTYFVYQYLGQMEMGMGARFARREDVLWYLMVVGSFILTLNHILGFGYSFFLQGLIIAMCYTVTQDQRGMKANFYIITIPAQLSPYCMIAINLVMPNGVGKIPLQIMGLVSAHLYDFLTRLWPEFGGGRNLLPTPAFVSNLVRTPRVLQRTYGTAIRSGTREPDNSTGTTTGAQRGPLPDSWRSRGPGQRLG
ncbi:centromere/microtubule-binding protein cbf5 [Stachybotrys elegans]|uniref:Derlin n=1 Tax=Stachybotrys elegans TaxID=80388 RepID=A0A8K0WS01_9HYPO|nr:centromere/microtubule-binding protein cbf5 [Stachybotrys elegans]